MKINSNHILIFLVIILISLIFRLRNINTPLYDTHYFRQTQTATVVRNFYRNGINLFRTDIDIFGTGKEKTLLLEFPLYQAIVTVTSYVLGFSDSSGRAVSIFFGISGGIVLYLFVLELTDNRRTALLSMFFYLFTPLNIFYHQAYMIESLLIFLHLLSLLLWYKVLKTGRFIYILSAVIITSLAFLQKVTLAPFLAIQIVGLLLTINKKYFIYLIGLLVPLILTVLWQRYADLSNFQNNNAYYISGNPGLMLWNIGTLIERFSYREWGFRILLILKDVSVVIIPPFVYGLYILIRKKDKYSNFILLWLVSLILYFLIFFRIQTHDYYQMILIPLVSFITAYGIYTFSVYMRSKKKKVKKLELFLNLFLILYMVTAYFISVPQFKIDEKTKVYIDDVNKYLKKDGNTVILLPVYDWNSVYTYYTDRKGKVISVNTLNKEYMRQMYNQDYRYLTIYDKTNILGLDQKIADMGNQLALVGQTNNISVYSILEK